jgi:hypothetical protein
LTQVTIDGIGLLAPGLAGWDASRAVLCGETRYAGGEMPKPAADLLPPPERRRCGETARLALHVGTAALARSGVSAADLPAVFTSSSGNGEVVHQICEALTAPEREVSPTRFHNSVHNAPAGYWSIATGSREPSTSLCVHHGSFAAGLLETALQARAGGRRVLLIAYDQPPPEPLATVAPVCAPFAVALVVGATPDSATIAVAHLSLARSEADTALADVGLEQLRRGNSAARALPLLAALARGARATVRLPYLAELQLVVALSA